MTDFFNLPSKAGQDTQNQYLSQIAQHLGVTAGNLQDAINMANQANQAAAEKITDLETRFQTLTAEQQQDAEVIDARDGENSLGARLDRYDTHLAEKATDANGVHGLKIEEGIWTPTLSGGNHTYLERSGVYYKIGKAVTIRFNILLQAKDGGMTGNALITGLPFAANGVFGVEKAILEGITMPSGVTTDYVGYLIGTHIELRCLSNGSWDNIKAENIGGNARIYASAVYFVG